MSDDLPLSLVRTVPILCRPFRAWNTCGNELRRASLADSLCHGLVSFGLAALSVGASLCRPQQLQSVSIRVHPWFAILFRRALLHSVLAHGHQSLCPGLFSFE